MLTDFAYYLIFVAYIAFTTTIDRPSDWAATVGAEQVQHNIIRVGGILLIIGVLKRRQTRPAQAATEIEPTSP